jgi:hypothetical protein
MKNVKHKNPMQTRHGRIRYKSHSVSQLQEMLVKSSTPKVKDKIRNALNYKLKTAP